MKMNKEIAMKIANEFLNEMNPYFWNGEGKKLKSFDDRVWVKAGISPDYPGEELDISFDYDEEFGWMHLVELVDTESNEMIEMLHGFGINSPQNLAYTIYSLLKGLEIADCI